MRIWSSKKYDSDGRSNSLGGEFIEDGKNDVDYYLQGYNFKKLFIMLFSELTLFNPTAFPIIRLAFSMGYCDNPDNLLQD
jgi:hypothetical protein